MTKKLLWIDPGTKSNVLQSLMTKKTIISAENITEALIYLSYESKNTEAILVDNDTHPPIDQEALKSLKIKYPHILLIFLSTEIKKMSTKRFYLEFPKPVNFHQLCLVLRKTQNFCPK